MPFIFNIQKNERISTEKLESMGLTLGKGDDTSHGKNAFELISHPLDSHIDRQRLKFKLIV